MFLSAACNAMHIWAQTPDAIANTVSFRTFGHAKIPCGSLLDSNAQLPQMFLLPHIPVRPMNEAVSW